MADTIGQTEIRGIDIDKLAKGFADEANIFKRYCNISKTKAREIRWYQKTSGFLDTADTTGITGTHIGPGTAELARPFVIQPSWTRQTSYIKKFFAESPWIAIEDIKDCDIDVIATFVRDVVLAVERKVDLRIWSVLTEAAAATPTVPNPTNVETTAATAEWDTIATCNPITDILNAQQKIRANGYDPMGSITFMNSIENKRLLNFIINVKGSSIPEFASEKVKSGIVMRMLGTNFVVSENVTTDWVVTFIKNRSLTWKPFISMTSKILDDPGIAKKFRCWEEGEAILVEPKSVHIISNTST